jgi:hypothetical protein
MRDLKFPMDGGCRCGQVRLSITMEPILTGACHCTGCQRMTASAFSLSIFVPSEGFAITKGEPVIGGLHGDARHYFCAHCMSWMFTRPPRMDAFVNVRVTMLDDPSWFVPFMETYTSEKLPWATTPAVRSFERFPSIEEYSRLMTEYRKR